MPNASWPGVDGLHIAADIFVIVTGLLAVLAYVQFGLRRFRQRRRLENYLEAELPKKRGERNRGARTVLHLTGNVGMTEAEILDAAFRSKHIRFSVAADPETGRADALYLRYE